MSETSVFPLPAKVSVDEIFRKGDGLRLVWNAPGGPPISAQTECRQPLACKVRQSEKHAGPECLEKLRTLGYSRIRISRLG